MKIKRFYKKDDKGALILENGEPVVETIKVTLLSKRQNFTQKFIDKAIREGYATLTKGKLILHTQDGDLEYKILRSPGYFCCHDNQSLGGEKECREYVAINFAGIDSPDKNNPSGYRKDNFHACELINTTGES